MGTPRLSILLAVRNEQDTIAACVERVLRVYPDGAEIVVVDGGNDDTGAICRELAGRHAALRYVAHPEDRGKGHAIRRAIAEARAPVMAQLDADLQFLPEELPRLVDPVLTGRADVVLGSRFVRDATRHAGSTPALRTLGNKTVNLYASALFGRRLTDVLAGVKAWSRAAAETIDLQSDDYAYEAEICVKAVRAGLTVLEVPVTTQARQGGHTKVHIARHGAALLGALTLFRLGLR